MIRPIKYEELDLCVKLIRNSFLTVAKQYGFTQENAPRFTAFATTVESLRVQYEEGRPMFAYLDGEGQMIGYYSLCMRENHECELNHLCVIPESRHSGIGKKLFHHAMMSASTYGCTQMMIGIVEENTALRAWYENLGAVHIGTKKYDFFPFTCGYLKKKIEFHFLDTTDFASEEVVLKLDRTEEADSEKDWVPAYHFYICNHQGDQMGKCDLRIGYNEKTYYGGNIGYEIDKPYRGHHYAAKACALLFQLAKKHEMDYLVITCNPDNDASRKTCEYAGGILYEIVELPEYNEMRMEGAIDKCIYEFVL